MFRLFAMRYTYQAGGRKSVYVVLKIPRRLGTYEQALSRERSGVQRNLLCPRPLQALPSFFPN